MHDAAGFPALRNIAEEQDHGFMIRKPVILVDGHVLDGKPQGTSTHIVGLYGEVARRGEAEVLIATQSRDSFERWFPDRDDVRHVPLPTSNRYRRLAVDFDALAAQYRPDYMHFQYIAPLRKQTRWIVTVHDLLFIDLPQYFPLRYRVQNGLLFGLSAKRADIVLTVSQYSRAAVARHFRIPRDRIAVTMNGLGSFAGIEPGPVEGLTPGNFFLYVSRFEPRKNQDGLIAALRGVQGELPEGFQLVLVGNPALHYPALNAELAAAGSLVRQLSNLSFAELVWLYRNARASLYPSFAEGFGIPPLEAVVAGGQSYGAANTAMAEIADHLHGSFDAGNTADIQRIMRLALSQPSQEPDPQMQARALADFSWECSADNLLDAIRRDLA
ncbi:MAG: glycosyltransferase family 1 protein [Roseovarius sp.]